MTAVAALKDAKQPFSFGVFSNSKNFHFRAESEAETKDWTDKIWAAAPKEVQDEVLLLSSPVNPLTNPPATLNTLPTSVPKGRTSVVIAAGGRTSTQTLDYSGPDVGSVSSLSDAARISQISLQNQDPAALPGADTGADSRLSGEPQRIIRNGSGLSSSETLPRVIWHGYLYCLKSKSGMKQWKKYWIVVRNINIGFYKNEEVYPPPPPSPPPSNNPRNTAQSRFSHSTTSWTLSKSTRSPNRRRTVSRSSRRRRCTGSARRTRKCWSRCSAR